MFTGLIQSIGTIERVGQEELQITWGAMSLTPLQDDLAIGDSISVDGICLTVTQILSAGFIASASPETLRRTTLDQLQGTASVNLEASLRVGSKLGGHFVTGHVDGVGYLEAAVPSATAWEISFTVPDARVSRYIVSKGSIAVNGVSLTVAECSPSGDWFKVAVIPLTYAETNLQYLKPGDPVNLEGDVLGKYVEKFLRLAPAHSRAVAELEQAIAPAEQLTPAFLAEHGYL
ncbi:riboflavin synthase [Oscillatoria sp. FACHB-1407]|uniref:riboflavin synthase n=1 Tax=Oscillatoria sp. FACHB-1407 TaxID=2692847 RepID=UPI001681FE77|nr:riboflavin synthase [Oscillatoria sp. FACHB-1407]MBD2463377.1 riboflavin synthase [Oscillatoria sp. FACHB-1407]